MVVPPSLRALAVETAELATLELNSLLVVGVPSVKNTTTLLAPERGFSSSACLAWLMPSSARVAPAGSIALMREVMVPLPSCVQAVSPSMR